MRELWLNAWQLLVSLWYWVPIGVVIGDLIRIRFPESRIRDSIQRGGWKALPVAAVSGAMLPLCACGVIPFLVTFLSIGVPIAPVLTFTAASPIMDPADFVLTLGVLGWRFAVWTVLAAIVLGLSTGAAYLLMERAGWLQSQLKVRAVPAAAASGQEGFVAWLRGLPPKMWFVGRYLLLAISLGAVLETFIPARDVQSVLGGGHWYGLPVGTLLGLATYGISSVPFVKVLLHTGAGPGAAMAFYLSGHATSAGLLATMATLVRRQTFILYIVMTIVVSMLFGVGYQVLMH